MLILVRHAEPLADPAVPAREWPLTAAGTAASADLCERLPEGAVRVASDELKAWMTLGGAEDIHRDPRLGEIRRPEEAWASDYRSRRREYVLGEKLAGWESHSDVARRFDDAVTQYIGRSSSHALVVGSHGMAMTIWLVSRGIVDARGAGDFWEQLTFPDLLYVDLASRTWSRPIAEEIT